MYVTDLDESQEALSLHVTMKCMTNSYTLLDETSLQPLYAAKPSTKSATEDQKGRYFRGVIDWRHNMTYSSRAYGTDRLIP